MQKPCLTVQVLFKPKLASTMRITHQERITIVQAVQAQDPAAQIFLYGSRTDDQALGGDIDVLLLSQKIKFANKPFAQVALEKSIHLNP